ncbi:hypothetical protein BJ508DRAFT_307635 [Ascobolus immersus RN42]|uniref:Uncharacterized protein n=1 Tax=Ascobolus immersus RN42 TaxID=1160509 RepID=A0A3N4I7U5_ASCIM|nr:hypothetical protein BJ508DRAFT_307635 [Ascobolus immersus RN42]
MPPNATSPAEYSWVLADRGSTEDDAPVRPLASASPVNTVYSTLGHHRFLSCYGLRMTLFHFQSLSNVHHPASVCFTAWKEPAKLGDGGQHHRRNVDALRMEAVTGQGIISVLESHGGFSNQTSSATASQASRIHSDEAKIYGRKFEKRLLLIRRWMSRCLWFPLVRLRWTAQGSFSPLTTINFNYNLVASTFHKPIQKLLLAQGFILLFPSPPFMVDSGKLIGEVVEFLRKSIVLSTPLQISSLDTIPIKHQSQLHQNITMSTPTSESSATPPSDTPSGSPPGKPLSLPPHYSHALFHRLAQPDADDEGFNLQPSLVPAKFYPFLALCQELDMTPYDQVLFDDSLQYFIDQEGVRDLLVMLYYFPKDAHGEPDGSFDDDEEVVSNAFKYVVAFVNSGGWFCTYTFDDGANRNGFKWEDTGACWERARATLRGLLNGSRDLSFLQQAQELFLACTSKAKGLCSRPLRRTESLIGWDDRKVTPSGTYNKSHHCTMCCFVDASFCYAGGDSLRRSSSAGVVLDALVLQVWLWKRKFNCLNNDPNEQSNPNSER